jgi:hypothetical protein
MVDFAFQTVVVVILYFEIVAAEIDSVVRLAFVVFVVVNDSYIHYSVIC